MAAVEVAALVVAIASAVAAVGAVWYARWSAQSAARSADASERSAVASEAAAALETQRRKGELTPRFRVTLEEDPDVEMLRLRVLLAGPPELERLDELTVWIQDDPSWRHIGETLAKHPTPDRMAGHVWGP